MTFQEWIDDAKVDAGAVTSFNNLTDQNLLRFCSEGLHQLQLETKAVKATVTVNTSAFDSEGTAPLDPSITVPTRCYFTPTGTTAKIEVTTIGPDEMAKKKMSSTAFDPTTIATFGSKLYVALEQNRLIFWPFQGLTGIFTFTAYAKIPTFTNSRVTDATSYWFGWDDAHLTNLLNTTKIPQEFEDAEEALIAYVAARILTAIPGWKRTFESDYEERMLRFRAAFDKVKSDQPQYQLNSTPKPYHGW